MDYACDHKPREFVVKSVEKITRIQHKRAGRKTHWNNPEARDYMAQSFAQLERANKLLNMNVNGLQGEFKDIISEAPAAFISKTIPLEFCNAFQALADSSSPEEEHAASKQVYRAKRAQMDSEKTTKFVKSGLARMSCKDTATIACPGSLKVDGAITQNRELWEKEIVNFYAGKYKDSSMTNGVLDPEHRK
jgi:hypothetical protein